MPWPASFYKKENARKYWNICASVVTALPVHQQIRGNFPAPRSLGGGGGMDF